MQDAENIFYEKIETLVRWQQLMYAVSGSFLIAYFDNLQITLSCIITVLTLQLFKRNNNQQKFN